MMRQYHARPEGRAYGSRLMRALAGGALTLAAVISAQAVGQDQRPVFRTGTDVVTIPVSVRSSGTPVRGLSAADFVLLDNGEPQTVEVVSAEAVPADVTLIVETSAAMKDYLGSIDGQMRKIAALIRPADRLEVLGASTYVEELAPLRLAGEQTIPTLRAGGLSSINDALAAALLREPDATRPHLVIALSDTIDTMSATTMQTVRGVAKYSSSVLTIAWITMDLQPTEPGAPPIARTTSERAASEHRAISVISAPTIELHGGVSMPGTGGMGSNARTEPPTRPWQPHYAPPVGRRITAFDPLKEAAEMTGGALYLPGVFTDRTASAIFTKLYSDYRQRYVLRYTASGGRAAGWHDVTVTVPRLPKARIDAKRGYFVESLR
jgi:VWFA-related protein